MHIIQIGLPKSGNFWLRTILTNILQLANQENRSFIQSQPIYDIAKTWDLSVRGQIAIDFLDITPNALFYRIGNIFRYPVDDIDDYINRCSLVWTHSQFSPKVLDILPKFDKAVYILRDPRDVAISWANFVFSPYMRRYYPFLITGDTEPSSYLNNHLQEIITDWVNHVGGYLAAQGELSIHWLFYENLLTSFDAEIEELLAFLEIELDSNARTALKNQVDFTTMKKDNPNHLRKGSVKQWVNILSEEQQNVVLKIAKPVLEELNYPLNTQEEKLPKLPVDFNQSAFNTSGKVVLLTPAPH